MTWKIEPGLYQRLLSARVKLCMERDSFWRFRLHDDQARFHLCGVDENGYIALCETETGPSVVPLDNWGHLGHEFSHLPPFMPSSYCEKCEAVVTNQLDHQGS